MDIEIGGGVIMAVKPIKITIESYEVDTLIDILEVAKNRAGDDYTTIKINKSFGNKKV